MGAPAVFLGTVELADPDGNGQDVMFVNQSVRIRVDEAFKGVSAGQVIELVQGGTDCDSKFKSRERAVFYLQSDEKRGWYLPWCTRALGSGDPPGDDLLFLRALPQSAATTRVSGEISLFSLSGDPSRGVPNVKVRISGSSGPTREVVTNAAGVYEVYGLPPGRYSVAIEVPKGLKLWFSFAEGSPQSRGDDKSITIGRNEDAGVSFELQPDTQVSGRMLDAGGAPVANVCLDLRPVDGDADKPSPFLGCSTKDGTFAIASMPPGKYWLVARDKVKTGSSESESTLYYPGVRDRNSATKIEVTAGGYTKQVDLRIPSNETRYKVAGRLLFADGVGAAETFVNFSSPEHGYSVRTSTGADGSFILLVTAGMLGQLRSTYGFPESTLTSCPQFDPASRQRGTFRMMDANPIPVTADADHIDLKLELPSPSCDAWPPRKR